MGETKEDNTLQSVERMAFQQSSDTESSSPVNIMDSYSDSSSPSLVDSDADSQDSVDIMTCQSAAEANSYMAEESLRDFERKRERQRRYREKRDKLRELRAQERSQLITKLKSFVYSNTDNLDIKSEAITEELITKSLDVPSLKEIKNMLWERQKRAEKRKEYQQRYRERHRERLRQREMERRRQLRSDDDSSRQNSAMSYEANGMSTSYGVEDPMGILIEVPNRVSEKSLLFMEKKRERQRRYREKHREKLRLREMERRRLMRTGSRRKSRKNSGAKKKETDDEMFTNPLRSSGVEDLRTIEIEVPERSEEDTILPHFLEQEPVSPVQNRRRKERNKKTRKRQLNDYAEVDVMSESALSEPNCINETVETNVNAYVLDNFETTQEYLNDNFERSQFGTTSSVCDGIVLKKSPEHAEILKLNRPEVNIKVENIEYDPTPGIVEEDLYTDPVVPYKMEIAELGPLENYVELEIGPELGPAETYAERKHVYIKTEIDPEEA